jgi:hypothetical protein
VARVYDPITERWITVDDGLALEIAVPRLAAR